MLQYGETIKPSEFISIRRSKILAPLAYAITIESVKFE
jgi:hypothetical protein